MPTFGLRVTALEAAGNRAFVVLASCQGSGPAYAGDCQTFSLYSAAAGARDAAAGPAEHPRRAAGRRPGHREPGLVGQPGHQGQRGQPGQRHGLPVRAVGRHPERLGGRRRVELRREGAVRAGRHGRQRRAAGRGAGGRRRRPAAGLPGRGRGRAGAAVGVRRRRAVEQGRGAGRRGRAPVAGRHQRGPGGAGHHGRHPVGHAARPRRVAQRVGQPAGCRRAGSATSG